MATGTEGRDVHFDIDEQQLDTLVARLPDTAPSRNRPGKKEVVEPLKIMKAVSMPSLKPQRRVGGRGKKKKARRARMQPLKDVEALELTLQQVKRRCADLEIDNRKLRSANARNQAKLASKDTEIEMILKKAVGEGDASGQKTALLHEKMLVCSLRRKCKQIKTEEANKQAELDEIKAQLKFSQLHELQIVVEEYYHEILRLRKFNELGREPNSRTKLSVLTELKRLRSESADLHAENAELNHRLTEIELQTEHTLKTNQKRHQQELRDVMEQLRSERSKATELESLGDISRNQLDQVISNTEGTRKAIDEYVGQISMLKAQLRSRDQELSSTQETLRALEEAQTAELNKVMKGNTAVQNETSRQLANLKAELQRVRAASRASEQAVNVEKEQLAAELGLAEADKQKALREIKSLQMSSDKLRDELVKLTRNANEDSSAKANKIVELETRCAALEREQALQKKIEQEIAESAGSSVNDARENMRRLKAQYEVVCAELKAGAAEYEEVKGQLLRAENELEVIKKHILKHRERRDSDEARHHEHDALTKKQEDEEDADFSKKRKDFNESSIEPKINDTSVNMNRASSGATHNKHSKKKKNVVV